MGLILIWFLNLLISFWNAYATGKAWAEAKAAGGLAKFMAWMGAAMSAIGFTWCYVVVIGFGGASFNLLSMHQVEGFLSLAYVILAPSMVFVGLTIMLDSWAHAFRNGGILNYGVATYNTFAQIHNTMSLVQNFGSAFSSASNLFSSEDDEDNSNKLVILLVLLALFGGILTTAAIIKKFAASSPLIPLDELESRRKKT